MYENEERNYVKWKERETEDPYELFDKMVHDRLRATVLPPLKVYVKSQEIESNAEGRKPMITIIHIFERKIGGISYYYQLNGTDSFMMASGGAANAANEAIKGFKRYILSKYLAFSAGI